MESKDDDGSKFGFLVVAVDGATQTLLVRRTEPALLPNLFPIPKEDVRKWSHRKCHESQQRRSPLKAKLVVHLDTEQRKGRGEGASCEGVRSKGAGRVQWESLYQKCEDSREDEHCAGAEESRANYWHNPVNGWRNCPCKPK
jgi:hypothetical protein